MLFRKFAALTLLCLLVLVQRSSAQGGASARIFFVDIGQGAGTLIVSPVGETLLMDGGPGGGGTKIGALLTALGIGTIDYTVVSHYHIDHISGITELINAGRVNGIAYDVGDGAAVEPPVAGGTRTAFLNYRTAATTAPGVLRQTLMPGTVIDLGGGMTVTAMAAAGHLLSGASIPITTDDLNSESISLLVQYNDFDFVVAGDLSGGGSTSTNKTPDVESYVGQMIGDVDVVQLSHHGSTTTTSQMYLSAIRAELALAQASENNTFGHPNREPVNKFLNTPNTNGTTFGGTTVPPAGVPPLFYQTQASHPTDDRVTRQAHNGAAFGNAGNGTLELVTDGTTFYTMSSRDDGGVRIPAGIHSYAVDGAGAGVTTNFSPTVLVATSPVVPLSTEAVTVSATVDDREDVVATVTLAYAVNGVAQAPVADVAGRRRLPGHHPRPGQWRARRLCRQRPRRRAHDDLLTWLLQRRHARQRLEGGQRQRRAVVFRLPGAHQRHRDGRHGNLRDLRRQRRLSAGRDRRHQPVADGGAGGAGHATHDVRPGR